MFGKEVARNLKKKKIIGKHLYRSPRIYLQEMFFSEFCEIFESTFLEKNLERPLLPLINTCQSFTSPKPVNIFIESHRVSTGLL